MTIDQLIDGAMRPVADAVAGVVFFTVPLLGADLPLIVVWLVAGGLFFTLYLRFINVRGFAQALRIVSGRYARKGDPGEISQFSALTTAVSGTVGIGNIAGVAVAISTGGPGATFWLIVAGLLGMSAKFAECTLGVLYRRRNPDGSVSGGPMHYLERGLGERGWPALGRALGNFYAAAMVVGCLGIGNMFQSNQAAAIFIDITGADASVFAGRGWLIGLLLAAVVALVIIGGIKSIASTTVKLVPAMAAALCGARAAGHRPQCRPPAGGNSRDLAGRVHLDRGDRGSARGAHHRLPARRLLQRGGAGQRRHRARHGAHPATGQRRLRRPARTVHRHRRDLHDDRPRHHNDRLRPGARDRRHQRYRADDQGIRFDPELVSGPAGDRRHPVRILDDDCLAYYGLKAFTYLAGEGRLQDVGFKFVFCAFVVAGAGIDLGAVIDLSDALVFVVAIPNLIGLYLMAPVVRRELERYRP